MSLLEKYQRVRNTFNYSIASAAGLDRGDATGDEIGEFQILLPNIPFPENQASQLAIFTLESFHFISQTDTAYVSAGVCGLPANSNFDCSGFYVEVNGLGVRGNMLTTATALTVRSNKMFPIVNSFGLGRGVAGDSQKIICGGDSNTEVICSNPAGSTLQVKVYSMDTADLIQPQAGLDSIINFKIELLPNDFQSAEM